MKLEEAQLLNIAKKIMRMMALGEDFCGFDFFLNNHVFFDKKNRNHYYSICFNRKSKDAEIEVYIDNKVQYNVTLKVTFYPVDNVLLVSRLTAFYTFPPTEHLMLHHFITLNEAAKETLK